jgi:hypothetical protein
MPLQIDEDKLSPTPGTGGCACGRALFYVRAERVGCRGHFHCRTCGRRFAFAQAWTPGEATSAAAEPR